MTPEVNVSFAGGGSSQLPQPEELGEVAQPGGEGLQHDGPPVAVFQDTTCFIVHKPWQL